MTARSLRAAPGWPLAAQEGTAEWNTTPEEVVERVSRISEQSGGAGTRSTTASPTGRMGEVSLRESVPPALPGPQAMAPSQEELDFDGAMAVLMEWTGRDVVVAIDASGGPSSVAFLRGTLSGPRGFGPPGGREELEFCFRESEMFAFSVQRSFFDGATYDGKELQIGMGKVIVEVRRLD